MPTDEHIPERIYVQAYDDGEYILWDHEATWCVDRVNDNDLVYVREDFLKEAQGLLKGVEWASGWCLWCRKPQSWGHKLDCVLAAALRGEEEW